MAEHPDPSGADAVGDEPSGPPATGAPAPSGASSGRPARGDGPADGEVRPEGDVYDWFRRGEALLRSGNPAAAAQLLGHAAAEAPGSRSVLEVLARAQFDARRFAEALDTFRGIAQDDPSDDYARFGWGLSAARLGDFETAAEQLALAAAMRPDRRPYADALHQARSTLAARRDMAS